jgi:hypothetical protein
VPPRTTIPHTAAATTIPDAASAGPAEPGPRRCRPPCGSAGGTYPGHLSSHRRFTGTARRLTGVRWLPSAATRKVTLISLTGGRVCGLESLA